MQFLIYIFVLLSTYSYCEQLLGGWSESDNQSLKRECLKLAIDHIQGDQANSDDQSQVSDFACRQQVVNGLNIKCDFVLSKQKWSCSFYKSFVQTLDTQLDECEQVEKDDSDDQVVKESQPSNEEEEDDEAMVDALNAEQ